MQVTNVGLEMIKMFESLRLEAYRDSVGVWTIGYGHTKGVLEGMAIEQSKAEDLLREDVDDVAVAIDLALKEYTVNLYPWQHDAITSFAFNLGVGALKKSKLFELVVAAQMRDASNEFSRWIYAGGKPLLGLKKRRFAEAVRFLGGDFAMVSMAFHGVS